VRGLDEQLGFFDGLSGHVAADAVGRVAVDPRRDRRRDRCPSRRIRTAGVSTRGPGPFRSADLLDCIDCHLRGAVLLAYLIGLMRSPMWHESEPGRRSRPPRLLLILPLGLLLIGMQPHLGLKDVQSFAMFSNLDTGNGQSNHAIIPASWQLSSNLSDVVIVTRSNKAVIGRLGSARWNAGFVLRAETTPAFGQPYLALKRAVSELARDGAVGIRIEYSRDGVAHETANAEQVPELANANFLERHYFATRPVALSHYGSCRW
jgi:hypothetical protein